MTGRSILVVEDELIVALEIKKTLIKLGYKVVGTEKDGQSAIETAGATNPDLVLMDIRLKGDMDGIEAAQRIGSLYQTPIIFLTAHSDEDTLSRALKTHPCGYLVKPFRERELYQAIEMGIHKSQVRRRISPSTEPPASAPVHPVENIPVPALLLREDGKVSVVNRAFSSLTGLSPGDCVGRSFETLIGLETRENSHILPEQMVIRTHDGSRTRATIKVGFMTTTGRPQPLITVTPDTGSSAPPPTPAPAPAPPKAPPANDGPVDFRQILDALDLPIMMISDDLRILYYNRPFGELLRLARISEFLLTRPIYEIEKFSLFGYIDDFRDVMGTNEVRIRERKYRKMGRDYVIRFFYIPMESGGRNVVTTLMYDISAETVNEEARESLSQAHDAMMDILNDIFRISAQAKGPVSSLESLVKTFKGKPGARQMETEIFSLASFIGRMDSALLKFDEVKRNFSETAENGDPVDVNLDKYTL